MSQQQNTMATIVASVMAGLGAVSAAPAAEPTASQPTTQSAATAPSTQPTLEPVTFDAAEKDALLQNPATYGQRVVSTVLEATGQKKPELIISGEGLQIASHSKNPNDVMMYWFDPQDKTHNFIRAEMVNGITATGDNKASAAGILSISQRLSFAETDLAKNPKDIADKLKNFDFTNAAKTSGDNTMPHITSSFIATEKGKGVLNPTRKITIIGNTVVLTATAAGQSVPLTAHRKNIAAKPQNLVAASYDAMAKLVQDLTERASTAAGKQAEGAKAKAEAEANTKALQALQVTPEQRAELMATNPDQLAINDLKIAAGDPNAKVTRINDNSTYIVTPDPKDGSLMYVAIIPKNPKEPQLAIKVRLTREDVSVIKPDGQVTGQQSQDNRPVKPLVINTGDIAKLFGGKKELNLVHALSLGTVEGFYPISFDPTVPPGVAYLQDTWNMVKGSADNKTGAGTAMFVSNMKAPERKGGLFRDKAADDIREAMEAIQNNGTKVQYNGQNFEAAAGSSPVANVYSVEGPDGKLFVAVALTGLGDKSGGKAVGINANAFPNLYGVLERHQGAQFVPRIKRDQQQYGTHGNGQPASGNNQPTSGNNKNKPRSDARTLEQQRRAAEGRSA